MYRVSIMTGIVYAVKMNNEFIEDISDEQCENIDSLVYEDDVPVTLCRDKEQVLEFAELINNNNIQFIN